MCPLEPDCENSRQVAPITICARNFYGSTHEYLHNSERTLIQSFGKVETTKWVKYLVSWYKLSIAHLFL